MIIRTLFYLFSVRLRLLNTQSFHEPPVLLNSNAERLILASRPLKLAFFKPFVEQESRRLPSRALWSCRFACRKTRTARRNTGQVWTAVQWWSLIRLFHGEDRCSRRQGRPSIHWNCTAWFERPEYRRKSCFIRAVVNFGTDATNSYRRCDFIRRNYVVPAFVKG